MNYQNKYELVMFVDDNNIDLLIGRKMVQLTGFATKVTSFNLADTALEYLKVSANQPQRIPEIIFLDLNMPIISGFDFLDLFGELPFRVRQTSKIVVLTSSSDPRDIAQAAMYPIVADVLKKPLIPALLESLEGKLTTDSSNR